MNGAVLRRRAAAWSLAVVLAACAGERAPWPASPPVAVDLRAQLSTTTVPLLGEFELVLDLYRRADLEVDFEPPLPAGCTGRVELSPEQPLGEGRWRRTRMFLRPIDGPGDLAIAPFRAKARDGTVEVATDELRLTVTTLLAAAAAELEAPAPPTAPRRSLLWWLAGGWCGLLAIAVLAWWWRRRSVAPVVAAAVAVPAHVKALRELARLRALPRATAVEIDAFYVATSQVLRVYLEERFGLRAPERTTEEFLLEVEAGGPLSVAQCLELRRFLSQCDLVKFAAQQPAATVHLQTLAIAELLIEATRADRAPLEASA